MQERKSGFSLAEVLPERLAEPVAVGGIIQRVVDQLKRDSDVLSEPEQGCLFVQRYAGDNGADSARGGDQSGYFVFDDAEVFGLGDGWIPVVIQLQHFAFGHLSACLRKHFIDAL